MDEKPGLAEERNPFPIQDIQDNNSIYRQVPVIETEKREGRRFPIESHFMPNPDLSVYLAELIEVKDVFLTIGLSFKTNTTEYKKPDTFLLYQIPVEFIQSLEGVSDIKHSPVYNGNPASVGHPNIPSHASVYYSPEDNDVRVNLSDYCRTEQDARVNFKISSINDELEELRQRLNNTRFHRI